MLRRWHELGESSPFAVGDEKLLVIVLAVSGKSVELGLQGTDGVIFGRTELTRAGTDEALQQFIANRVEKKRNAPPV